MPAAMPAMKGSRPDQRVKHALTGEMVSKRSKTGHPECSQAMSAWKTSGMTSAIAAILGKCRAMAGAARKGLMQRAAGNEAKAQVLEHRARTGKVGMARSPEAVAAARARLAAERLKRREKAPPLPERDQIAAGRKQAVERQTFQERMKAPEGRRVIKLEPRTPAQKAVAESATATIRSREHAEMAARGLELEKGAQLHKVAAERWKETRIAAVREAVGRGRMAMKGFTEGRAERAAIRSVEAEEEGRLKAAIVVKEGFATPEATIEGKVKAAQFVMGTRSQEKLKAARAEGKASAPPAGSPKAAVKAPSLQLYRPSTIAGKAEAFRAEAEAPSKPHREPIQLKLAATLSQRTQANLRPGRSVAEVRERIKTAEKIRMAREFAATFTVSDQSRTVPRSPHAPTPSKIKTSLAKQEQWKPYAAALEKAKEVVGRVRAARLAREGEKRIQEVTARAEKAARAELKVSAPPAKVPKAVPAASKPVRERAQHIVESLAALKEARAKGEVPRGRGGVEKAAFKIGGYKLAGKIHEAGEAAVPLLATDFTGKAIPIDLTAMRRAKRRALGAELARMRS